MTGFAGALVGLQTGQQSNIAPAQALVDGSTTSKGCTTNFVGFGFGLGDEAEDPANFSAADDTVVRAIATSGTVQTPGYTAVTGTNPPRSTLAWTTGAAAAVPTNSVAPSITGTASVGSTLTAVNGTWAGTPTPTYTYAWQRLNGSVVTDLRITAGTYVPVAADVGGTIRVTVTGRNPAGILAVNSAATAAVT
jgi:hypothetical protein